MSQPCWQASHRVWPVSLALFVGPLIPKLPTDMDLSAMVLYAGHEHDPLCHTAFLPELGYIVFASSRLKVQGGKCRKVQECRRAFI